MTTVATIPEFYDWLYDRLDEVDPYEPSVTPLQVPQQATHANPSAGGPFYSRRSRPLAYAPRETDGSSEIIEKIRKLAMSLGFNTDHFDELSGDVDSPSKFLQILDPLFRECERQTTAQADYTSGGDEAFRHTEDFRCVNWRGTEFVFTKLQAAVVRLLWNRWNEGLSVLRGQQILREVDSNQIRLGHVFRRKKTGSHPAWGSLIVWPTKGCYRLNLPDK